MKTIILFLGLFLMCAPLRADQFSQRAVTLTTYTSVGSPFQTGANCRSVTFVFKASYAGTVGGQTFASTDVPLTIMAQSQDTLRQIPFTCTAGSVVVVEQK